MKRHLSVEGVWKSNNHTKTHSASPILRKINWSCSEESLHTMRLATTVKEAENHKCKQGYGERMLMHCWWEGKIKQPLWKHCEITLKKQQTQHSNVI